MTIPSTPENEARFAKLLAEKESVEAKRRSLFRAWQQVMDRLENRMLYYGHTSDKAKGGRKQYTGSQLEAAKSKAMQEARLIVWMFMDVDDAPASESDCAADEPAAIDVRPLDELLWFVGSRSGHGEALPWVELNEPYQLLRWPSMAALRGVPGWPRLAALWFARPCTLRDMLIISGFPRGEVIDFLNACLMCQHARAVQSAAVNQPAQAGKPNPDPRFSKIRTKLGIADGASLGHESERV